MELSKFNINELDDGDIVIVKGITQEQFKNLQNFAEHVLTHYNKTISFILMPETAQIEIIKLFKSQL